MSTETEGKCPVLHGAMTTNSSSGTSHKDWWPTQFNFNILHQHENKTNPMGADFDYRDEFKKISTGGLRPSGWTVSATRASGN